MNRLFNWCSGKVFPLLGLLTTLSLCGNGVVQAADFVVTSPGFLFSFNGTGSNPTIFLQRGKTYTFQLNTSPGFHPFTIGTAVSGPPPPGVSGAVSNSTGTITFAVPTNANNCVYYCIFHTFSGSIVMVDPPPPPTIQIVGLELGANLTLKSTVASTNGLVMVPEFSTNLLTTNWFALTVQTNQFANGTNEAICGKPPGEQVFVRIRAQQN